MYFYQKRRVTRRRLQGSRCTNRSSLYQVSSGIVTIYSLEENLRLAYIHAGLASKISILVFDPLFWPVGCGIA